MAHEITRPKAPPTPRAGTVAVDLAVIGALRTYVRAADAFYAARQQMERARQALDVAAGGMELWAAWDHSPDTVPWTRPDRPVRAAAGHVRRRRAADRLAPRPLRLGPTTTPKEVPPCATPRASSRPSPLA